MLVENDNPSTADDLTARVEPFDSYWQAPKDVEKGYVAFEQFYRSNYGKHLPVAKGAEILVVSCGPGYFVSFLNEQGYPNVLGIDSDPAKIRYAEERKLNCRVERVFSFLENKRDEYDAIVAEQELNHLTKEEIVRFLELCRKSLKPGGQLMVYGLNGANPITGAEALAQNFDHFNTFTEYSLRQVLELTGFVDIRVLPLKLYVFYKNPLNYVGMAVTMVLHLAFRACFKLYGKSNRLFTKKIAATARKAQP